MPLDFHVLHSTAEMGELALKPGISTRVKAKA